MTALLPREIEVLLEALDDEYRAWATYDQVLSDFGDVRPFTNIRESEARHIDALLRLFEVHGLPVPDNPWIGRVDRYPSLQAACAAGVAAETANGAMYDRLIAATQRPDIRAVLRNLQEASQQRHLPAFRRGAERSGGGGGGGPGRGGRRFRGGRGAD